MNGVLIGFSSFFDNLQSFGNCWSSTTLDSYFRHVRLVHHSIYLLLCGCSFWVLYPRVGQCGLHNDVFDSAVFRSNGVSWYSSRCCWFSTWMRHWCGTQDEGWKNWASFDQMAYTYRVAWTGRLAFCTHVPHVHAHFFSRLGSQSVLPVPYPGQLQVRVCCKGVHHNRNLRVGAPHRGHRAVEVWLHLFTSSLHICWSEILKL